MNHMKRQLREVRIEDFDTELLLQAAREGRLFIAPGKEESDGREQQYLDSILDYVKPIAAYATCPCVGDIWEAVLRDERLTPLFFLTRYGSSRGQVNWYRVTALMCLMRDEGLYCQDISASGLHCILEGTTRRNRRYTGMGRYLFDREQIRIIRQIVNKMRL